MIWAAFSANGKSEIIRICQKIWLKHSSQLLYHFWTVITDKLSHLCTNAPGHRVKHNQRLACSTKHTYFLPPGLQNRRIWVWLRIFRHSVKEQFIEDQIIHKMRHSFWELFRKNREVSTCGTLGASFFQCPVDAQHLRRLLVDIQN